MKKNNTSDSLMPKRLLIANLLFEKVAIFIAVCLCTLLTPAHALGQQAKVKLDRQNVLLEVVMSDIEKQTPYLFIYDNTVKVNFRVTIKSDHLALGEVLQRLFKGTNIKYSVRGNHIILSANTANDVEKTTSIVNKTKIKRISGTVMDNSGAPLAGATITELSSKRKTVSDQSGVFFLFVEEGGDIKVSSMGFAEAIKTIGNQDRVSIVLEPDAKSLDELVVTGYQTMRRGDVTGSYTTIDMKDIYMPNYATVDKMLQGIVPGMVVMNNSSRVGTSPSIKIRGTSTLLGNTSPLWVIDGVIQEDPLEINASTYMSDDIKNIIGNQVSWLNPQDIETVTVLKDASATAVYGSKASNGVIVITTKQAKGVERLTINYSGSTSVNTQPTSKRFNMMNSQERIQFSDEVFGSGVPYLSVPFYDRYSYEGVRRLYIEGDISIDEFAKKREFFETINTDWFKLLTRTGVDQNHNLSLSASTEKMNLNSSVGYNKQQGQEVGNDAERITGRLAVGVQLNTKMRLNLSILGGYNENTGFGTGVNPIGYATATARSIPAFDEAGNPAYYQKIANYQYNKIIPSLGYNFINERDNSQSLTQSSRLAATADFSWKVLPWLNYSFVGGYNYNSNFMSSYMSEQTYYIAKTYRGYDYGAALPDSESFKAAMLPFGGEYFTNDGSQKSYNIQNKFTMAWTFEDQSRLNVLLGHELRSADNISTSNTVWGYSKERGEAIIKPTLPKDLIPTAGVTAPYENFGILDALYSGRWKRLNQTNNFMSVFATAAYTYGDRYVVNATVRNDFSNRFGQDINNRIDPAYSFGLMWRLGDERFVKENMPQLSQFNLRATYGIQGNALTNESPDMILIRQPKKAVFNQFYSTILKIPNPNLTWERTTNWNFGADLTLFKVVNLVADYYVRRSNAVLTQEVPYEFGIANGTMNGGIIHNKGLEASVSFAPFNTPTTGLSVSINGSKNWNEAGKVIGPSILSHFLSGRAGAIVKEGYPVDGFWSYSFAGLDPATGTAQFNYMDVDPELGKKDPSSFLVYSGQRNPSVTGGLGLNFRYKSLSINSGFALLVGGKTRLANPYENLSQGRRLPIAEANLDRDLMGRWKKPGDEMYTNLPSISPQNTMQTNLPSGGSEEPMSMWSNSDVRVANASFLRMRNLDISWRFSKETLERLKLKNLVLGATVNNLFVVASKRFQGMDPELKNSVMPKSFSMTLSIGI